MHLIKSFGSSARLFMRMLFRLPIHINHTHTEIFIIRMGVCLPLFSSVTGDVGSREVFVYISILHLLLPPVHHLNRKWWGSTTISILYFPPPFVLLHHQSRTVEGFIDMRQMVIICYPCKSNRRGEKKGEQVIRMINGPLFVSYPSWNLFFPFHTEYL